MYLATAAHWRITDERQSNPLALDTRLFCFSTLCAMDSFIMTILYPGDKGKEDRVESLDDEKKRALDLYTMKLVPPETVLIFDEPTRCYRINKEWAAYVMGMVSWLAEIAPWRDAQDESYFAIEEIQKFLVGVECMAFGLRQSPVDSCIMQQTLDGVTWTDVFDFSQCATIQDKSYQISIQNQVANAQETFIDIYNNYTANYTGLPSSVYPALAAPVGDDSALKAALCNAIWELIKTACNAAVSFYNESIDSLQSEANFLLAIGAFALAAVALAGALPTAGASLVALAGAAPLIAAGFGLGAGLANYLADFYQQHTVDQFQDTEAMEEVACYLVDELAAGDVSLADVQAALSGHSLTGNAAVIADSLSIMLANDGLYAAFLEKWNNNKQYADAGIDLYCPCATEYKVWVWDFSNGMGPFTLVHGIQEGGRLKGTEASGGSSSKYIEVTMPYVSTWRTRGLAVNHERIGGITHGSLDSVDTRCRVTPGTNVGNIGFSGVGGFLPNGIVRRCIVVPSAPGWFDGVNELYIAVRVIDQDPDASDIFLDKIEIQFEADYAKGGYITDDSDICT